jgi:hypothetical protein
MTYELKGGEYVRGGKLYGWTGRQCGKCGGHGEDPSQEYGRHACVACAGTGEEHALMPAQPDNLPPDTE